LERKQDDTSEVEKSPSAATSDSLSCLKLEQQQQNYDELV
jgi:hypothetical protein